MAEAMRPSARIVDSLAGTLGFPAVMADLLGTAVLAATLERGTLLVECTLVVECTRARVSRRIRPGGAPPSMGPSRRAIAYLHRVAGTILTGVRDSGLTVMQTIASDLVAAGVLDIPTIRTSAAESIRTGGGIRDRRTTRTGSARLTRPTR
jgi:hypothetical protein